MGFWEYSASRKEATNIPHDGDFDSYDEQYQKKNHKKTQQNNTNQKRGKKWNKDRPPPPSPRKNCQAVYNCIYVALKV